MSGGNYNSFPRHEEEGHESEQRPFLAPYQSSSSLETHIDVKNRSSIWKKKAMYLIMLCVLIGSVFAISNSMNSSMNNNKKNNNFVEKKSSLDEAANNLEAAVDAINQLKGVKIPSLQLDEEDEGDIGGPGGIEGPGVGKLGGQSVPTVYRG